MTDYTILFGGKAGEGVKQSANLFGKLMRKLGYYVYIYDDYPSVIRGSHNYSVVRFSSKEVEAINSTYDIGLFYDKRSYDKHKDSINKGGVVVYDENLVNPKRDDFIKYVSSKFSENVAKLKGKPIQKNVAYLSVLIKLLGIEFKHLELEIREEIGKEIRSNLKIARAFYNATQDKFCKIKELKKKSTYMLTGNEATAKGAVASGLDNYFAYPMTPSTGILHHLAENQKKYNIGVFQPENEIGVIMMGLGSSYAGAKTMVGTSGGGFALMTEGISFSGISEVPITIVLAQRAGPATGVPTYSAQADLNFATSAGHGEFPRLIVAPTNAKESYELTSFALGMSQKYQIPSIILTDKNVAESTYTLKPSELKTYNIKAKQWNKKGEYNRYKLTSDGISPLAFPGSPAIVRATSYEHLEDGLTTEDETQVQKMQEKRARKWQKLIDDIDKRKMYKTYGFSDTVIVCWGSTKGPVLEAASHFGYRVVTPLVLSPLPDLSEVLIEAKRIIVIEANMTGQLAGMLESEGYRVDKAIVKYDSRPYTTDEILSILSDIRGDVI